MKFTIYDETGKITGSGECPDNQVQYQQQHGEYLLIGESHPNLNYVLNGAIEIKPVQTTALNKLTLNADGIDSIAISSTPTGLFKAINVMTGEAVSGEINGSDTFSTTIPGTYQITITAFPFLDFTTTVEAT
jgi:hypothetical protein